MGIENTATLVLYSTHIRAKKAVYVSFVVSFSFVISLPIWKLDAFVV